MALTNEQLKKLTANKRNILPTYYNATDGVSYKIPSTTEDALILLASNTKKKAVAYLKEITKSDTSKRTEDYNKLLAEVAQQQVTYSDATAAELQQITGKFNDFLNSFSGSIDDAGVTIQAGMQPVLQAMTRTMGRLVDIDQHEYFHSMFNTAVEASYTRDENFGNKKELRSWIRAIVSYP